MSQNLQNFVKFQKFQLENLVDFEKCCKTHIFLQKSEPIQPKTSNTLPNYVAPQDKTKEHFSWSSVPDHALITSQSPSSAVPAIADRENARHMSADMWR